MIAVDSSNIESIGHDGKNTLRVKFKTQGAAPIQYAYDYIGIETDDFLELVNSYSVGKSYAALIKERGVKGVKIEV